MDFAPCFGEIRVALPNKQELDPRPYVPSPRFFEAGNAVNRIWEEAPFLPRCSDNKTAALVRPREYAIRYPYMQINRSGFVSWLIFDLDHAKAMIWEDAGLPAPNLIVRNRATGASHLFYAITPVCTSSKARSKPIAFMKAVYAAFALRLDADLNFHSGPVAKTPGHPWWLTHEVHGHTYELGELADYVELEPTSPWKQNPNLAAASHSRHCMLFEELRHYAYSIVAKERDKGSFERFTRLLEAYAFNKNHYVSKGFETDLPHSSLRATVKSVSRWTWDRYTGSGSCRRGLMKLDSSLPLPQKQRLAAAHARSTRQKNNEMKVRVACRHLKSLGQAITQVAAARLCGLTRQTIASYRHVLAEVANTPLPDSVLPLQGGTRQAVRNVKFAVHQVTAVSESVLPAALGSDTPDLFDG